MITMTKLCFSGLRNGERDVEIKIVVDVQKDWFEVMHTKGVSQVLNKTSGEYIIVHRNTLKHEVIS